MSVVRYFFFFFKQKTAYEMRISDWSSDVCSSDLPVEPGEDVRLDVHALIDGFDDEIGVSKRGEVEAGRYQRHALFHLRTRHPPLGGRRLIVAADGGDAAIQRFLAGFDQRDGDARVQEVHRDAAAHRARADDADRPEIGRAHV